MRNAPSWLVVAAVAAVALAASVDAFRGDATSPPPTTTDAERTRIARAAAALARVGVRGVLTYTDEKCRIRAVALPDLGRHPAPDAKSCAFVYAGGGRYSLGRGVPGPRGAVRAVCRDDAIEVRTFDGDLVGVGPGCAPTWNPHGILTAVRDGEVIELDSFPGRETLVPRLLLSRQELAHRLRTAGIPARAAGVEEIAWVSPGRLAAIIQFELDGEEQDLVALFDQGWLDFYWGPFEEDLSLLRVSRNGTFLAARIGEDGVFVFNSSGAVLRIPLRTAQPRAVAWSLDERWMAVATPRAVEFFRLEGGGFAAVQPLVRAPIRATDLVWR